MHSSKAVLDALGILPDYLKWSRFPLSVQALLSFGAGPFFNEFLRFSSLARLAALLPGWHKERSSLAPPCLSDLLLARSTDA